METGLPKTKVLPINHSFGPHKYAERNYAWPLLSVAIKLARELGYQALTTGNLEEDDPKHKMGEFYHENGFNPYSWQRPRSIFDEGSYLELAL